MKLLIFGILLLPSVAFADEFDFTRAHAGESYNVIRGELIESGWHPEPVTEDSDCFNRRNDDECLKFPEIQSCSSGSYFCRMHWVRGDEELVVITVGGDPGRAVAEPRE